MKLWHSLCVLLLLLLSACTQYDDEEHEKNLLLGMLAHGRYAALEQALLDTEQSYQQQALSTKDWQARWYALANVTAGGTEKRLNAWVKTESAQALLLRGMWWQVQAWRQLEDEPETGTEQKKQQAELERMTQLALADLQAAQKKLGKCALCITEQITANRALNKPLPESQALLEAALALDPLLSSAIYTYFVNLYPEWGGSFLQMREFINQMKTRGLDNSIVMGLESRYSWQQAKAAMASNEQAKALAWLERGVTSEPYDVLMKELAAVYTNLGEHDKAVQILEQNLKLNNPWDMRTIDLLARAYVKSGQREQAAQMMAKRSEVLQRYSEYR